MSLSSWLRREWQLVQAWFLRRKIESDLRRVMESHRHTLAPRALLDWKRSEQAHYMAAGRKEDVQRASYHKGRLDLIESLLSGESPHARP